MPQVQTDDASLSGYDYQSATRAWVERRAVTRLNSSRVPPSVRTDDGAVAADYEQRGRRAERLTVMRDGDFGVTSGLAWFSIALGVTQIVAPYVLARLIGLRPSQKSRTAMRAIGIRELTTGYGLLSDAESSTWLWSRLAGDVMDLSLLGAGVGRRADDRSRATRAALAVGGVAALNFYAAARSHRIDPARLSAGDTAPPWEEESRTLAGELIDRDTAPSLKPEDNQVSALAAGGMDSASLGMRTARHTVHIERPSIELYAYWRDFANLPAFMHQLESVTKVDGARSHWVTRAPGGAKLEWDAEIVADVPGELIAWQSAPDANMHNAGTVRFISTPSGRSTDVHLDFAYRAAAGALGEMVAKLFGVEPGQQAATDLEAFRQLMASGNDRDATRGEVPNGLRAGDLPAAPVTADAWPH